MPADNPLPLPTEGSLAVPSQRLQFPEHQLARRSLHRWGIPLWKKNRQKQSPVVFMWGPPGGGKTRLATALARWLGKKTPPRTSQILDATEVYELLRDSEMKGRVHFLNLWKQLIGTDLLIIENLQLLVKKQANILLRLLDQRVLRRAATLFTSTKPIARLTALPARLTNRLAAALQLELPLLSLESRMLYLARQFESQNIDVETQAIEWIAQRLEGSFRKVQSAVNRVRLLSKEGKAITCPLLEKHFTKSTHLKNLTMENIVSRVGNFFQVSTRNLQGKTRQRQALLPRQVGMYLARRLTSLSLEEIGAFFGRDHTTVIYSCKKVARELGSNLELCGAVKQLETDLA